MRQTIHNSFTLQLLLPTQTAHTPTEAEPGILQKPRKIYKKKMRKRKNNPRPPRSFLCKTRLLGTQMLSLGRNVIANYIGRTWAAILSILFVPFYVKFPGIEAYGLVGFFCDAGLTHCYTDSYG